MTSRHDGRAKVTAEDVEEIRALAADGMTRSAVARQFGLSPGYVGRIVRGDVWPSDDLLQPPKPKKAVVIQLPVPRAKDEPQPSGLSPEQQAARQWFAEALEAGNHWALMVSRLAQPLYWFSAQTERRISFVNLDTEQATRDSFLDAVEIAAKSGGADQVAPGFVFIDDLAQGYERFFALRLYWNAAQPRVVDPIPYVTGYLYTGSLNLWQLGVFARRYDVELPLILHPGDV